MFLFILFHFIPFRFTSLQGQKIFYTSFKFRNGILKGWRWGYHTFVLMLDMKALMSNCVGQLFWHGASAHFKHLKRQSFHRIGHLRNLTLNLARKFSLSHSKIYKFSHNYVLSPNTQQWCAMPSTQMLGVCIIKLSKTVNWWYVPRQCRLN